MTAKMNSITIEPLIGTHVINDLIPHMVELAKLHKCEIQCMWQNGKLIKADPFLSLSEIIESFQKN